MEAKRRKCYFNIFSLSVYLYNYSRKKKLNFPNCMRNSDVITRIGTFLFENFSRDMNLVSRIRNFMIRNKKYTHISFIVIF